MKVWDLNLFKSDSFVAEKDFTVTTLLVSRVNNHYKMRKCNLIRAG